MRANRKYQIESHSKYNNPVFIEYLELCINRDCVTIVSEAFNYKSQNDEIKYFWDEFCSLNMMKREFDSSIQDALNYGGGVNK